MSVVAHAGGTGWDELLFAAMPFIVSAAIYAWSRHRAVRARPVAHNGGV